MSSIRDINGNIVYRTYNDDTIRDFHGNIVYRLQGDDTTKRP